MTEPSAIDLKNVCLSLSGPNGSTRILDQINLEVNASEKVSLVGPSGSGKTSLLMIMAGLERATSGDVLIAGEAINEKSEDAMAVFRRDHIGIVFQNFHLIPTMTALENVAVPLEFAGREHAHQIAQETLGSVGLSHRMTHFPAQLSGGEQQRVALARAFAMQPKILLADEPTGNLDQETGQHIISLMFDLHAQQDTTLLLITHDPVLAKRCDHSIIIRDGSITDA